MKIKAITISTTNGGIGWNDKLPWFSISIVDKNFNEVLLKIIQILEVL